MANYDRVFWKYFEKVTRRTVFLDVNGNILNPSSFYKAYIMKDGKEVNITNDVRNFYHEDYYLVCKDPRVDTLKSSVAGAFQYRFVYNTLAVSGGNPVLTPVEKGGMSEWKALDFTDNVKIEPEGNIPFKYVQKVYDPKTGVEKDYEAAGLCKVTLSDPSMAGKTVFGFYYGTSENPSYDVQYTDKTEKVIKSITCHTWSFEDENFREIRATLYLK